MVDKWPSRLQRPHLLSNHEERQGVAALAPQFDQAVPSSRRSVAPIGTLSPQPRSFHPSDFSNPDPLDPFQTHAVLTPTPKPQSLQTSTSQPLQLDSSPSIPAADFLAEITHSAEIQSAKRRDYNFSAAADPPHQSSDFDLFGIANLDLGPPVFDPKTPSTQSNNLPSPNSQSQQNPHHSLPNLPIDHEFSLSSPVPPLSLQIPSHTITAPSASPLRTPRELAHPTRCVLLRNIPPGIDDDDIRQLLQLYGPLRDLGAQQRSRGGRGSVLATYYDLRHARGAVRALDTSVHFGRRLEARFQCPADAQIASPMMPSTPVGANASSPSANQGTLVVFNLDTSTSAEDIRALFNTVGDVKEIRATPNKKHHKFVEFYDVRDAERAMHMLNKTEVAGKRIKIEISRPGGRSGNFSRHATTPTKVHPNGNGIHHQPLRHQTNPGHVQYPEGAYRNSTHQSSIDTFSQAHLPGPLLSSINHGVMASTAFPQTSPSGTFEARQTGNANLTSVMAPNAFETTGVHSRPYDRTFTNAQGNLDLDLANAFQSYESAPESRTLHSPTDPRENELHTVYQSHARQLSSFSSGLGQHGMSKPAPDSYIQALYNSPGSDEGRGLISSPLEKSPRRGQFNSAKGDVVGPDGGNTGFFRGHFGDTTGAGGNVHGRHDHAGSTMPQRKVGLGHGSTVGDRSYSHTKQASMKTNLHSNGGGKPYNQQQNNSKYALDIRKVRTGEETRTALMIRNIPNKYNQKMLLSTLEEGHKGHFDFIYLPIDFKNKCNVGYAFINFTKPEFIEPFYDAFHGKKWGRFNSEKVCEITFARIQGRQQLIAHFQNSSLLLEDPKCRPVIFDSRGRQEEFPIGSHVRTRRGPSSRDSSHRTCDTTPPYSPTKHRGSR